MKGAFYTGKYRNLFGEFGYDEDQIAKRVEDTWQQLFYGDEDTRIYYPVGDDMGYLLDTGNNDVRTEGMSYGMMMCVQMDKKEEFDRIWKWSWKYMQHKKGRYRGYFAWSLNTDGTRRADGPAPDGEEFFAMALLFASKRWGDGPEPFDYSRQAKYILRECVHKGEDGVGHPMWDPANKLIKFVPETPWTDPSYHLPHFYELFSILGDPGDSAFWCEAADASREYLRKACHPVTGLAPEYAEFDGRPHKAEWDYGHHHFYSDSYRVAANIGLDYEWFGKDEWQRTAADRIQAFFAPMGSNADYRIYAIDGTPLEEKALHPVGLIATNAMASLAATDNENSRTCVELFWNTPVRTGVRRYYDNCLYLFAMLALSGNYRIWK
ncbi:MAG: xylanase [Clostridiaceae bacterium]|nr:xylanase [Clostridiaceae bacterium]